VKNTVDKFVTTPVVYHGPGALGRLQPAMSQLGVERIGIVTDPGIAASGIVEKVREALETETSLFSGVQPEPPLEVVDACVAFLRDNHCDACIALGGGSSIDVSKMAAAMTANPGKVADYLGVDKVPKAGLPVVAIPTTAGTGSEVSPAAVFVDTSDKSKKGVRSDLMLPKLAILDPELTLTLPQALTASTGIDALTHAIEGYTSRASTLMGDVMAEKSIALISRHLRVAYADGSNLEARYGMLMASYAAGFPLAIASTAIVHALAQTMGGEHKIPHGQANALFLPYCMEFNRISCREKFADVATKLGEPVEGLSLDEASLTAVEAVRALTRDLGIPQRLRELKIPESSLDALAERCVQTQGRLLVLNPRTASLDDLKAIVRSAY